METITFNDCRKCGSKPQVRAFGSLHLVTCPNCSQETLSDPDLADLAKRWNKLNPTPNWKETLEAKREKCLRVLVAEIHSMEEVLRHPFLVGDVTCAKSNVYQAAYDLGEVVFELAKIEEEETHEKRN